MNKQRWMTASLMTAAAMLLALGACQKTTKTASAGGGSSTQSVMSVKGAAR